MKLFYSLLFVYAGILFQSQLVGQNPVSHAVFHCISLYWKPAVAAAGNTCSVNCREEGTSHWKTGYQLWFNPNSPEGRKIKIPEQSFYCHFVYEDLLVIEKGKIGLRLMFTRSSCFKDFKIYTIK